MIYRIAIKLVLWGCIGLFLPVLATAKPVALELKKEADSLLLSEHLAEALEIYVKSIKLALEEEDDRTLMGSFCHVGNIYDTFGDYRLALYYWLKAYEESVRRDKKDRQAALLPNIVRGFCYLGNLNEARKYFEIEKCTPNPTNYSSWQYYLYYNEGQIYSAEGKYDDAVEAHQLAADYARKTKMDELMVLFQESEIGNLYVQMHLYDKAIACGQQCMEKATLMNNRELLVNAYKMLTDAYTMAGEQETADRFRILYVNLNDSVYDMQKFFNARYKLLKLVEEQSSAHIEKLDNQLAHHVKIIIFCVLLIIVSVVFILIIFRKNRKLRQAQMLLIEKSQQLEMQTEKQRHLLDQYLKETNDEVHADDVMAEEETADETNGQRQQPVLSADTVNLLLKRILAVFDDMTVISNPEFNQQMLADIIKSNTTYVSWVINETYGKNFKTLLNEYRIREACRRLTDTEHYGNHTIQAIYEGVGYSNANSFIRAFKKVSGMTPSVYQQLARRRELY